MADQPARMPSAPIDTVPGQTQLIPSIPLAHFAIGTTFGEFALTCGRTRVALGEGTDGEVGPQQVIEWFQALLMSPQTAKLLRDALTEAVEGYEKATRSKIPDPPEGGITTRQR